MGALYKFDLEPWITKYGLVNYLETGTGLGTCLEWARKYNFEKIYSIELDEEFVNNLKHIEQSDFRVKLINNYSVKGLPEALSQLPENEPLMFFGDGHFIGNPDHYKCSYEESIIKHGQASFPLEEELGILTSLRDISKDVIIVDDFVLYEENLPCDWAKNNSFQYRSLAKSLGINLTSDFLYKTFEKTHDITIDLLDQGYFIACPKDKN